MAKISQMNELFFKMLNMFRQPIINYDDIFNDNIRSKFNLLDFETNPDFIPDFHYKVDDYNDIKELGNLTFNNWYYIYINDEAIDDKIKQWFIHAFYKLSELTIENKNKYDSPIVKLKLFSSYIEVGNTIDEEKRINQYLTIDNTGEVKVSEYHALKNKDLITKERNQTLFYNKYITIDLLAMISTYFEDYLDEEFIEEYWKLELISENGTSYYFSGALYSIFMYNHEDLSTLIRNILAIKDLILFDAIFKVDRIDNITINLNRKIKREYPGRTKFETPFMVDINYHESIVIDRASETLEHTYGIDKISMISHKYQIQHFISDLLNEFESDELFMRVESNQDNRIINLDNIAEYNIVVKYQNRLDKVIKGHFDKQGLPKDYAQFIEKVFNFISYVGLGELFNPKVYNYRPRRKDDLIYCKVQFNNSKKSY